MKVLILCTGNSCRSQMAEAILQSFDKNIEVFSAGTAPSNEVHPNAIAAMAELGINLKTHFSKSVQVFQNQSFDYVITVCGGAKENCPTFSGAVKNTVHIGFEDPAEAFGTPEEIMQQFRIIRDEILRDFYTFYHKNIKE